MTDVVYEIVGSFEYSDLIGLMDQEWAMDKLRLSVERDNNCTLRRVTVLGHEHNGFGGEKLQLEIDIFTRDMFESNNIISKISKIDTVSLDRRTSAQIMCKEISHNGYSELTRSIRVKIVFDICLSSPDIFTNKNKRTKWIVDSFMFDNGNFDDSKVPREVFEKAGVDLEIFQYIPFMNDKDLPKIDPDDKVVIYGTISFAKKLNSAFGCYLRQENFDHNVYYSNFKGQYLNDDCVYVPFGRLIEHVTNHCEGKEVFCRPVSGMKSFTGNVFKRHDIEHEVSSLKQLYNIFPEEMVVVSSPKSINEEYRFIIADRKIVDCSLYRKNNKHKEERGAPENICNFVKGVVESNEWQPDDAYTLDVAVLENGEMGIIELNSFSSAGWYACDPYTVINAVTEMTEKLWKESH